MIGLAALLTQAPALIGAAKSLYQAVSGKDTETDDPRQIEAAVESLDPADREAFYAKLQQHIELQQLDTQRFTAMTDGDAEKVKATARPEIARKAMDVIATFMWCFRLMVVIAVLQWSGSLLAHGLGQDPLPSFWGEFAKMGQASELIWGPLLGSFWACVEIIKKYMGCRERDKAQEYEIKNGKPLESSGAVAAAANAAEGIAGVISAIRSKK